MLKVTPNFVSELKEERQWDIAALCEESDAGVMQGGGRFGHVYTKFWTPLYDSNIKLMT